MDKRDHQLLIDVKDLTWGYEDSPYLLFDKFNFALYSGDFTIIMGKSGCGKSTLVKLLIGQKKAPPKTIYHKREDMSKYSEDEIQLFRRKVGIIFQDYKLINSLSVKDNITYPLRIYSLGDTIIDAKYEKVKKELNIDYLSDYPVKYLSGGEKQKVGLARALIHDPEFIIADEPTGNLDREHTQQLCDILIDVNKKGDTVLLITHDVHVLNYLKSKYSVNIFQMC
ncbi:ABC transporter ATP-binding protein [Candidatus Gracilibacteria bacterium]|nr:ABC transporter ATP-binding protein [Candidatus Gracilibacteria bacterium]